MKWLMNKAALSSVETRLEHGTRVLLFMNFDSILAPRAAGRHSQPLDTPQRNRLREISEISRLTLTLISDLDLGSLRKMAGFSGSYLIANYGLEISGPDLNVVHSEAKRFRTHLAKVLPPLRDKLKTLPNVVLEDRGLAAALDFSAAKPAVQRRTRLVAEEAWTALMDRFILMEKNKEMILRPRVGWNKGRAVMFLWNKFASPRRRPVVVYLGSDEGDDDVYNVMGREGVGIAVGSETKVAHAKAGYFLKNRAEVNRFLNWLNERLARQHAPA